MSVELFITRGYLSRDEKRKYGAKGNIKKINYRYLTSVVLDGYFLRRMEKYIFSPALSFYRVWLIRKQLNYYNENIIIWPSVSIDHLRTLNKTKRLNEFYFIEINEFPDIHMYGKTKFHQRYFAAQAEDYFEKFIIKKLDGMALITRTLLSYYKNKVDHKTKLLHLPMTVDIDRFNSFNNENIFLDLKKPYIVYIGSLNNMKDGIDILIKAFKIVENIYPQYKLYLFGSLHYDTPNQLKLINTLDLSRKVIYMGEVDSTKVPGILLNADLLVLPRPDSHQARGGFPTKLGEYLASGVPVCCTTVGEIPDYLEDGVSAFFAEPGSVDSFAHAMVRALSDLYKSRKVGLNGRSVAEKFFNKDIQSKVLYNFLKSLNKAEE